MTGRGMRTGATLRRAGSESSAGQFAGQLAVLQLQSRTGPEQLVVLQLQSRGGELAVLLVVLQGSLQCCRAELAG